VVKAADALPSANRIEWSLTGVPGGIPQRSAVYKTLKPSASASDIQTALDHCPSGKVVLLDAGTYSLEAPLTIAADGVTLRGVTNSAGEPTTILNFNTDANAWGLINIAKTTYPTSPDSTRAIKSGFSQGSTSMKLSSPPTALKVGQMLALDQIADNQLVWDHGTEGGGTWGRNGDRTLTQFVRVTGIQGTDVTFTPAIYSGYWKAAQSPEAYWWGSGASQTVKLSGIEDLKINRKSGTGGIHNLAMGPADSCWIRNVWSTQCANAHVRTGWTLNCEIRDCCLSVMDNIGSSAYAVWLSFTSAARVENNVMFDVPCAVGMMSTTGSAIAYNFATKFPYSQPRWLPECVMTHGGHCDHNLFEGNFVPSFWADFIHGNASFNSYVRNRVTGWESGKTDSTRPINIEAHQANLAFIGNVLGTTGYHNLYENRSSPKSLFNIDPGSKITLFRKGNSSTLEDAVPKEEDLGSDTIASSYLYASKPAWFGDRPWPPVDPKNPQAAAVPTRLPAGYRYQSGRNQPAGGSESESLKASRRLAGY